MTPEQIVAAIVAFTSALLGAVYAVIKYFLGRHVNQTDEALKEMRTEIRANRVHTEAGDVAVRQAQQDFEEEVREKEQYTRERLHAIELSVNTFTASSQASREAMNDLKVQMRDISGKLDTLLQGLLEGKYQRKQ